MIRFRRRVRVLGHVVAVDINRLFSTGEIDQELLWPKIVEYEEQPCTFRFTFGLDELPTDPGIILVRGPRQYGKSTWLELKLRETLEENGRGAPTS